MFEMELPEELMFERFVSMENKIQGREVEELYRQNMDVGKEILDYQFARLLICPEPRQTLESIEQIILKSELKMGAKIQLVLIDYVQLLQGYGSSRYERMSNIAEGLKVLAKATKTIIVISSQISRPPKAKEDETGISLHDAKDSGSLEWSSGLVIGAWRDFEDATIMHMKVLKATKGGAGTEVQCNFDGARMIINESGAISDADMPQSNQREFQSQTSDP